MSTDVLTIRLPEDLKEEFTETIESVIQKNNLKRKSDAFPFIINAVKSQIGSIVPDFEHDINLIRDNLETISSRVFSMNEIFKTYQENQEQAKQDDFKVLITRNESLENNLLEIEQDNQEKDKQIQKLSEEIKILNSEKEKLESQLSLAQKELDETKESMNLLNTLKDLIPQKDK